MLIPEIIPPEKLESTKMAKINNLVRAYMALGEENRRTDTKKAFKIIEPFICDELLLYAPDNYAFLNQLIRDGVIHHLDPEYLQNFIRRQWDSIRFFNFYADEDLLNKRWSYTILVVFHIEDSLRQYIPDDISSYITAERLTNYAGNAAKDYEVMQRMFEHGALTYVQKDTLHPLLVEYAKGRGLFFGSRPIVPLIYALNRHDDPAFKLLLDARLWVDDVSFLREIQRFSDEFNLKEKGRTYLDKMVRMSELYRKLPLLRSPVRGAPRFD